ncbi:MAG TPA: hypothetical protein PKH79_03760 [Prolixibacteraceae bacterium]|nr:hypothetical protein [Prolixibacteraceae bacterium]
MKRIVIHSVQHLLPIVLVLFLTTSAFGQLTESRQLTKGFRINKTTTVDVGNKYGDISFETWEKDSVRVEIFVRVSEKSREKLRKKMDEISFELTQSGHYVVINTLIGNSKNVLFSELNKFKENIGISESQVEINMKVMLPSDLSLRISNKFGNVYIEDYKGDLTIDMANGKLKANDLSGYVNLKTSFGDAIINSLNNANLEVYYGKLNLSSAQRMKIISKTSDVTITEVGQLTVNSSRDTYRIRMIDDLQTESSWTDFSITEFKHKSDVRMNYGDISIENVRNSFESIYIDAHSSKIDLCFDKKADVNFDITTDKELNLPMNSKIDKKEQVNPGEKRVRYFGRTGDIKIEEPKLVLKTSSGEINILKR